MELETFLKRCKMETCLSSDSNKQDKFVRMLLLMNDFGHDTSSYLSDIEVDFYSPTWINFSRPDADIAQDINFALCLSSDANTNFDDYIIRLYDIDSDMTYGKGYISAHIRELAKYKMNNNLMTAKDYVNLVERVITVRKPFSYNFIEASNITIVKIIIKDPQTEREFKDVQDIIKNF